MKVLNSVLQPIILIIIIAWYFALDYKLYFYGESDFDFYTDIPFDIKPINRSEFEGGFGLYHRSGSLVAQGNSYRNRDSIFVKEILKYCYNDHFVFVEFIDIMGKTYWVKVTNSKDSSLNVDYMNNGWALDRNQIGANCVQIKNKTSRYDKLIKCRVLLFVLAFMLIVIVVVRKIMIFIILRAQKGT